MQNTIYTINNVKVIKINPKWQAKKFTSKPTLAPFIQEFISLFVRGVIRRLKGRHTLQSVLLMAISVKVLERTVKDLLKPKSMVLLPTSILFAHITYYLNYVA